MRVNADSLLIRAATTSTSGTLNDLTTDLIMANNNNNNVEACIHLDSALVRAQESAISRSLLSEHLTFLSGQFFFTTAYRAV